MGRLAWACTADPCAADRLAGQRQPREPGQQRGQGDLRLQPGERRAQAVVDPAAERQRRLLRPVQDEPVRVGEDRGVPVGRTEHGEHPLAVG
jgi:hypothetical protein